MIFITIRQLIFKTVKAEQKLINSRVRLFCHYNGNLLTLLQILSLLGLCATLI